MRLMTRFGSRKPVPRRRPAAARLQLQSLEDRALPSFGFGSAFSVGGTGGDIGRGITLDAAGNMYVAGQFTNTVDFDPSDVNHTNSAAILTSASAGTADAFVAKYSSNGTFQWVTDLGAGTASTSFQIATQGSNVYVLYQVLASSTNPEAAYISALDTGTGAVKWTTTFGANSSQAWAVAVSSTGSLYAAGYTYVIPDHAVVERLDPVSGNILWTQTSGGGEALADRLTVDSSGNVYAAGIYDPYDPTYYGPSTFGSTALTDPYGNTGAFVWKLNSSGGSLWAGTMGSSTSAGIFYLRGLTADGSGNVYVAGEWDGGSNNFNPGSGRAVSLADHGGLDAFIVKLTPGKNGAISLGWADDIGGSGNDYVNAMAVDSSGNVYTTGLFNGTVNFNPNSGTAHDLSGGGIFVSKLDANGNYVAAVGLGGTADGSGLGAGDAITIDASGGVYVTGSFDDTVNFNPNGTYNLTSNGAADVFVLKLTQTSPQLATSRGPGFGVVPLTQPQLNVAEAAAIRDWEAVGLPAADIAKMNSVTVDVADLGGDNLGAAELNGDEIALDATADGWGWSVDPNAKPTAGRMDLLTVVEHELGHTIGLDSRFTGDPNDLMYAYLNAGERRLPGPADGAAAPTAAVLLSEAPHLSAEDQVDWLSAAATLKPKNGLYADWLNG